MSIPEEAYTIDAKKAICKATFINDESRAQGSFTYKIQKYPSDIDLMEIINHPNVIEFTICRLLEIIHNLKDGYYFIGLDAGSIPIQPGKNLDRAIEMFIPEVKTLPLEYAKKTLEKSYYDAFIHEAKKLRWSRDDVLVGYNQGVSLPEALQQKGKIKIEIIAPVDGRLIEVSNVLALMNNNVPVNIDPFENIGDQLKKEVVKFTKPYYFKPFKLAKRMYSVALFEMKKNYDMTYKKYADELAILIGSDISMINQVVSDIETIIHLFELNQPIVNKDYINKEIDGFKMRLTYIIGGELEKKIDKWVDERDIISIKNILKPIINNTAKEYLDNISLYPPPDIFTKGRK